MTRGGGENKHQNQLGMAWRVLQGLMTTTIWRLGGLTSGDGGFAEVLQGGGGS